MRDQAMLESRSGVRRRRLVLGLIAATSLLVMTGTTGSAPALTTGEAVFSNQPPESFAWIKTRTVPVGDAPFRLRSRNRRFHVAWQPDGNFVLYGPGGFARSPFPNLTGRPGDALRFEARGWVSVLRNGGRLDTTGSVSDPCLSPEKQRKRLTLRDSGTLFLHCGDRLIWRYTAGT